MPWFASRHVAHGAQVDGVHMHSRNSSRRLRPLLVPAAISVAMMAFAARGASYCLPAALSPTKQQRGFFSVPVKSHSPISSTTQKIGKDSAKPKGRTRMRSQDWSGPTETLYDDPSSSDGARARMIIYAKGLDDYLRRDEVREDAWQLTSSVAERPLGHNVRQWESMDADIIGKKVPRRHCAR